MEEPPSAEGSREEKHLRMEEPGRSDNRIKNGHLRSKLSQLGHVIPGSLVNVKSQVDGCEDCWQTTGRSLWCLERTVGTR